MDSLQKLSLPAETLERVKQLTGDLRLLCAKEVFKEAIEGKFWKSSSFQTAKLHLLRTRTFVIEFSHLIHLSCMVIQLLR